MHDVLISRRASNPRSAALPRLLASRFRSIRLRLWTNDFAVGFKPYGNQAPTAKIALGVKCRTRRVSISVASRRSFGVVSLSRTLSDKPLRTTVPSSRFRSAPLHPRVARRPPALAVPQQRKTLHPSTVQVLTLSLLLKPETCLLGHAILPMMRTSPRWDRALPAIASERIRQPSRPALDASRSKPPSSARPALPLPQPRP